MADTPAPQPSGSLPTLPSIPPEDLSGDKLLRDAPRVSIVGVSTPVPSLAGIPLLARVGRGGMGAVYYGVHPRLGKHVAIKVLPFHLAEQQPELVERFQREARFAARVRSPHLVDVSDVNEEQGLHYIVMEYVHGVSAAGYLKEVKAAGRVGLAESEALAIVIAAAKGLAAAHEAGVVHRDVKPDNVLLPRRADGSLDFDASKLADLGLARSEDGGATLTVTQAAMGTPGYMAPEQGLDVKSAGKPADVFGIGASLYALLSGRAPFAGSSPMKVMLDTASTPHIPIASYRQDLQELTRRIVNRCLEKRPEDRYPDAAALLAELERARSVCLGHTPPPPVDGLAPTLMKSSSVPGALTPPASAPEAEKPKPPRRKTAGQAEKKEKAPAQGGGVAVALVFLLAAAFTAGWWWMKKDAVEVQPANPGGREVASGSAGGKPAEPKSAAPAAQSKKTSAAESQPIGPEGGEGGDDPHIVTLGPGPAAEPDKPKTGKVSPAEAAAALNLAIPVATDAQKKGQWKDVVVALEDPLEALGDAGHPLRALAERMLRQAEENIARETRFEQKLADAETFYAKGGYDKAEAAYLSAAAAWPGMPAERKRLVEEGLAKTRASKAGGALAAAKQAMEKTLQDVRADKLRTFHHVPLAQRNRILDAALDVLALDPNDAKAEDVRDQATGLRMLAVDVGSCDGRAYSFDRMFSTLLEHPELRMLGFPGAWISVQANGGGPRMWRKWEGEAGWSVRFTGPLMRLESEETLLFNDLTRLKTINKLAGIDATTEEGLQALLALPQGTRLSCAAVKNLTDAAVVEALAKAQVVALTVTDEGNLAPLRRLTSLRCLELGIDAEALAPLDALKDLEALRYDGSVFAGADVLARLPKLQHLAVSDFDAENLSFLPKLGGLRTLVVSGRMEVASLALLADLNELEILSVSSIDHEGEAPDDAALGRVLGRLRKMRMGGGKAENLKLLKWAPHLTNLESSLRNVKDLGEAALPRGLVVLNTQYSSQIRDFSPFGALRYLRFLSLSHNELLDSIAFAKNLPRLQYLSLIGCPLLSDLKPLRDLNGIESLILENCPLVEDLDPLLGLTRLRALYLNGCDSIKFDTLRRAVAIDRRDPDRYLRALSLPKMVGDKELEELAGSGIFKQMRSLTLRDLNRLTRLSALSPGPKSLVVIRCEALESLDLGVLPGSRNILLADCSKVASLTLDQEQAKRSGLEALRIEDAPLLKDVACLRNAAELRLVEFENCDALPRAQVEALAKALPKCRVEADGERVLSAAAPLRPVKEIFDEATNYRLGKGVPKDLAKAVELYREAAERGYADAQGRLALALTNGEGTQKNVEEGFAWMEKASNQNFPDAVSNLGYMYQYGMGVAVDLKKAVELYRRAADLGSARGQCGLGLMHMNGIGVSKDELAGVELIRRSAQSGFEIAQIELAKCYEKGLGVAKDLAQALQWYSKAAGQGNSHAEYVVGSFHEYGIGTKQDMAQALAWYRKGEAKGNANALNSLGYLYEWGKGVERDLGKAFVYYGKAIESGDHEQAWHNIGRMYEEGKGIPKDRERAVKCYRKSASKGYQPAIDRLKELGLSAAP